MNGEWPLFRVRLLHTVRGTFHEVTLCCPNQFRAGLVAKEAWIEDMQQKGTPQNANLVSVYSVTEIPPEEVPA